MNDQRKISRAQGVLHQDATLLWRCRMNRFNHTSRDETRIEYIGKSEKLGNKLPREKRCVIVCHDFVRVRRALSSVGVFGFMEWIQKKSNGKRRTRDTDKGSIGSSHSKAPKQALLGSSAVAACVLVCCHQRPVKKKVSMDQFEFKFT